MATEPKPTVGGDEPSNRPTSGAVGGEISGTGARTTARIASRTDRVRSVGTRLRTAAQKQETDGAGTPKANAEPQAFQIEVEPTPPAVKRAKPKAKKPAAKKKAEAEDSSAQLASFCITLLEGVAKARLGDVDTSFTDGERELVEKPLVILIDKMNADALDKANAFAAPFMLAIGLIIWYVRIQPEKPAPKQPAAQPEAQHPQNGNVNANVLRALGQ